MPEPDWYDPLSEGPLVADEAWWWAQQDVPASNGPVQDASGVDIDWIARPLDGVADEPSEEPTLGGIGIVYPGKRHVFSGPQESAKTLLAYGIGLAVVRAGSPVVAIDFEMGALDCKRRFRELGATDADMSAIHYLEPFTPATPTAMQRLVELQPGLVIIDAAAGAYQAQGLDDNKRGDVEAWSSLYVRPFWKAGIASIVLDHVVKNRDVRGVWAIGSERKTGGTDVHLGFDVVHPLSRGGTGVVKITTHKDRMGWLRRGRLGELKLTSDPDTHAIAWHLDTSAEATETHGFRPTTLMEKVSVFLERQMDPVPRSTVEKAGLGKTDYVRVALDVLTDEGFVMESAGPNRARLVQSLSGYREDADQVRPVFAPVRPEDPALPGSPVRPTPYRGGELRGDGEGAGAGSPQPEIPYWWKED